MSLIKKESLRQPETIQETQAEAPILARFFHDLEGTPEFSLNMALVAYENLRNTCSNEEELFFYLVEDCISASLYATFYEELFHVMGQNKQYALPLVDLFIQQKEEREQVIAAQTQHHMNFIENKGLCPGCPCCDNHTDVAELIQYFMRGDVDFFTTLYIGMQTINFTMDHIMYDVIPTQESMITDLSKTATLELRQYIFDYVEQKI